MPKFCRSRDCDKSKDGSGMGARRSMSVMASWRIRAEGLETCAFAGKSMFPGLKAWHRGQRSEAGEPDGPTTYHLDFPKRVGAVVEQIACLSAVDAYNTEHQRAAQAQRERRLRSHDLVDVLLNLVLQDLLLGELFFGIGGQPNVSQRAGALQQLGWIKHGDEDMQRSR